MTTTTTTTIATRVIILHIYDVYNESANELIPRAIYYREPFITHAKEINVDFIVMRV